MGCRGCSGVRAAPSGVGQDGNWDALAPCPSLRCPQHREVPESIEVPNGVLSTTWGAQGSLSLYPKLIPAPWGVSLLPPTLYPSPRQETAHCGGCGQEGSRRGGFFDAHLRS